MKMGGATLREDALAKSRSEHKRQPRPAAQAAGGLVGAHLRRASHSRSGMAEILNRQPVVAMMGERGEDVASIGDLILYLENKYNITG